MKYVLVVSMVFLTSACLSMNKGESAKQNNKSIQERKVAGTEPDADAVKPGEFIIVIGSRHEPLYREMTRYCDATKSFTKLYDTMGGGNAVICVKK